MSTGYFNDYFYGSSLKPGGVADSPIIVVGELGPVSTLCHVAKWYLERDDKLRRMFPGDKIEVLDTRIPFDNRDLPRLQIYGSSDTQSRRPTRKEVGEFEIFFAVRFSAEEADPLPNMGAGVSDVMWHLHKILRANHQLKVTSNGEHVGLARRSSPGSLNHIYDVVDERGKLVATHELPWVYTTFIDEGTGLFETVYSAGGS